MALPAAAIRFAFEHPAVSAVVVGVRNVEEIRADVDWALSPLPPALHDELRRFA